MNLNQVTVPTLHVAKAIEFYSKLGLQLIVKSPHYARFVCPGGESTFSVHLAEELASQAGITVYFECNDLDEKVKQLQASRIIFEEEPNDKPWLWREARLKDPDGNQIVLYFAGENRLNPPWRI